MKNKKRMKREENNSNTHSFIHSFIQSVSQSVSQFGFAKNVIVMAVDKFLSKSLRILFVK